MDGETTRNISVILITYRYDSEFTMADQKVWTRLLLHCCHVEEVRTAVRDTYTDVYEEMWPPKAR